MMASKRRVRRRQCGGKIRHENEARAVAAMFNTRASDGALHVYRCGMCGGWHVGHKKQRNRRGVKRTAAAVATSYLLMLAPWPAHGATVKMVFDSDGFEPNVQVMIHEEGPPPVGFYPPEPVAGFEIPADGAYTIIVKTRTKPQDWMSKVVMFLQKAVGIAK